MVAMYQICRISNTEYDKLFKILQDKHNNSNVNDTDNASTDYNNTIYDWENDVALREMLEHIINFDGIDIEIIGQWIWLSGNTYTYKKSLKELGFKWANQKKQWYWHTEKFRKKSHKSLSIEDIRTYYGSTKVYTQQKTLLEA